MSNSMDKITGFYALYGRAANWLQSPLLLAVRLYWGWQFFQTGWGKLGNVAKVVDYFTSLGIPLPAVNAYSVSGMEVVGGVLLFLGLGSRLIALPLAFDMLVAYIAADREALHAVFSDPAKFYNADPFTFLMASLIVLAFGSGVFSLDYLIARWRKKPA